MEQVDTLIVDKTGTLTEGKPRLTTVKPAPGNDEESVVRLAASLERGSEHPLASAILIGRPSAASSSQRSRISARKLARASLAASRGIPSHWAIVGSSRTSA